MRRKEEEEEEEEDSKLREGRGGMAMGEPHAWQVWRAWRRSSRIANMWSKETREIETMPRREKGDPCKTCRNSDCGGHVGATMMQAFKIFL